MSLIIVTDKDKAQYFNLEDEIYGKWGYLGLQNILQSISDHKKKSNDIEEIMKIM